MAKAQNGGFGLDLGTKTFSGLGIHVSLLWVLILFVLVTVLVCVYGGLNQGLVKRQLPETEVHGDLTVKDNMTVEKSLKVSGAAVPGFLHGLTVTDVDTTETLTANSLNVSAYDGGTATVYTLPAATQGTRVVVTFAEETDANTNTMTIDCGGSDKFTTGSVVPTTASNKVDYDTSTAGETSVVFTPAAAKTNFISAGSIIQLTCVDNGLWQIDVDAKSGLSADPGTALTGTLAFAS